MQSRTFDPLSRPQWFKPFEVVLLDQAPFVEDPVYSYFGLHVSFLMGFEFRLDLSLALFLACVQ